MKPKIVIVDSHILNPGDLSWDPLCALGSCHIYERTPPHLTLERCVDADVVLTNKVLFLKEQIEKLPKLKYISVTATGYNNVDVSAAKMRNIVVTNVPGYSTISVAQHVIALLLEVTNQVGIHNQAVQNGEWSKNPDFSFWKKPLLDLHGLTFGIIGLGAIGKEVAKLAAAFGMKVIVHTRTPDKDFKHVDRETLFRTSDVISLHSPLTEETKQIIQEKTLNLMKPNAILINTSRGGLIHEKDLAAALKKKKIYAAALDVLDKEPPAADCPLFHLDNCLITPHIAWASFQSRQKLLSILVENLKAFLAGSPINQVKP